MSQGDNINRVNVKIFGEEYTMKSSASPDYMKRLAQYVDEKMIQINYSNNRLDLNKIAVLMAINMADELFQARKDLRELEELLDKRTSL